MNQDREIKKVWRVSDEIGDTYLKWQRGQFVIINAGTGTGKSYFISNELYEEAHSTGERILFISNRDYLKEQNRLGIKGKEETITILNYQAIEKVVMNGEQFNFDTFKYVVCDEAHYFMTDSGFNRNNDLSLNAILKIQKSVVIFMSATGESFFRYLKEEQKERLYKPTYYIKRDYSCIKKLYFFNEDSILEQFIADEVKDTDKVLYFLNDVEDLVDLHKKYSDSMIIYSDPMKIDENGKLVKKVAEVGKNDKYAKYLERDAIREIIETKTLSRKFTFTTTTLDNGVDLFGEDIKWIIVDGIRDLDILVQCVGRKRFIEDDPDDKVSIIIRNIRNKQLNGMRTELGKTLKAVNAFIQNGTVAKERYSNVDYCIYDKPSMDSKYGSEKKINLARYLKVKTDFSWIDEILEEDKFIRELDEMSHTKGQRKPSGTKSPQHVAFIRTVLKRFDKGSYILLDEWYKQHTLSDYLESIVGKVMLTVPDRKELIERMDVKGQRELLRSLDILNAFLKERQIDYYIKQYETSRMVDGKKEKFQSAWKVMRLSE